MAGMGDGGMGGGGMGGFGEDDDEPDSDDEDEMPDLEDANAAPAKDETTPNGEGNEAAAEPSATESAWDWSFQYWNHVFTKAVCCDLNRLAKQTTNHFCYYSTTTKTDIILGNLWKTNKLMKNTYYAKFRGRTFLSLLLRLQHVLLLDLFCWYLIWFVLSAITLPHLF